MFISSHGVSRNQAHDSKHMKSLYLNISTVFEFGSSNSFLWSVLGKRSCLGEILARQMIFLFLTSLTQRFDFRPSEGQDSITVKEVISFGVFPSEFEMRLIPRINNEGLKKLE